MRRAFKYIVFIIYCFQSALTANYVFAQSEIGDLYLPGYRASARLHYGTILSHRESMTHLIKGRVTGLDFTYGKQTSGIKPWQQVFNYPAMGLGLYHSFLGNPGQLGTGTAVYGYMFFPLITKDKFWFRYRWGTGPGYISKPFDRVDNYKNTAIGSKINLFANLLFETGFKISDHLQLTAGLGYSHFSNAAVKTPNLGINMTTLALGISYNTVDLGRHLAKDTALFLSRKFDFFVYGALGLKEVMPAGGNKYGVVHFFSEAARRVGNRRKIGVGPDIFYDDSDFKEYNSDTVNIPAENRPEFIKMGVHISHELVLGRLSAIVHIGVYLHNIYKSDGLFYHRFGYRYYITDHLFIDAGFKTHWAVAKNIEFGVGYNFNKRS